MKNKEWYFVGGFVIVLAIVIAFIASNSEGAGEYNNFAQCLTDEGAKMYGAFWCSHCNYQKDLFGDSFKKVNYIECSNPDRSQNAFCSGAGITSYPTWEFGDGQRLTGSLPLEQLSAITGCGLIKDGD